VDAVSVGEATVAQRLLALEDREILVDIAQVRRHGQSPRYSVNGDSVKKTFGGPSELCDESSLISPSKCLAILRSRNSVIVL